jgi:hypothetical protein
LRLSIINGTRVTLGAKGGSEKNLENSATLGNYVAPEPSSAASTDATSLGVASLRGPKNGNCPV